MDRAQNKHLIPFTGADDPRRSVGKKPGHRAKIRAFMQEETEKRNGPDGEQILTNEDRIVLRAITDATEGDAKARAWLWDRLYGKAMQPTKNEHSGPNGGPIEFSQTEIDKRRAEILSGVKPVD